MLDISASKKAILEVYFGKYSISSTDSTSCSTALRWRHNGHGGVWNHQPHVCLLKRLFRYRSKKPSKLHVTGFVWGHRWIPRTKGQLRGKYFPLMTSSWNATIILPDSTSWQYTKRNLLLVLYILNEVTWIQQIDRHYWFRRLPDEPPLIHWAVLGKIQGMAFKIYRYVVITAHKMSQF